MVPLIARLKMLMASLSRLLRPLLYLSHFPSWTGLQIKPVHDQRTIQRQFMSRIPRKSWDSHMHVLDPRNYPLSPGAKYTPKPHLLSDALKFESSVSIKNMVLVQPSIYGNDNSCMLDALRVLGPRHGRAVVSFDPKNIDPSTLGEWHRIGVRGVRINLQSVGRHMNSIELRATLQDYANIIRPYGWVLQLYVPLETAIMLEHIVPDLKVKVCLDHFAHPHFPAPSEKSEYSVSHDPYLLPGFRSLVNLLRQGNTYMKMSAPYRISSDERQGDLEPVAKELLRVAGNDRIVFASDWPHTRFEGLNIKPFVERVLEWCENDRHLIERLFRHNAEQLWAVETDA